MFEETLLNYLGIGTGLIFSLLVRDLLSSFASGLSFYLDRNFHEGDNVIVNDEEATIVKIGFVRTIFRMKKNGNWYFVHNQRIEWLKLEKVIED